MDHRYILSDIDKLEYDFVLGILHSIHRILRTDFYIFQRYMIYLMDNLCLQHIPVDNSEEIQNSLVDKSMMAFLQLLYIQQSFRMVTGSKDLLVALVVLDRLSELVGNE